MDEFINEFKAEATSIVNNVQQYLLLLENDQKNTAIISDIFRGVHSLKGSSRMFGYDSIEIITHELENIFEEIRQGTEVINTEIISLSLKVMDIISHILSDKTFDQQEYDQIIKKLKEKDYATSSTLEQSTTIYQVLYHPNENIYERGVNPMGVFSELEELGAIKTFTIHQGKALEKQEENKKFESKYEIFVELTSSAEDLEDVFLFMDASEFEIHEITSADSTTKERDKYILTLFSKIENQETSISTETPSPNKDEEETKTLSNPEKTISSGAINFINVKLDRLDEMMKLVSELVTIKAELSYQAKLLQSPELSNNVERLEKITSKFKDNAFSMRLVPLQILALKFQRLVRDIGNDLGKQINFISQGLDTEIDKSVINEIEAPLMHIIQNAIDHGLETPEERVKANKSPEGLLKIVAFYAGTNVFIQIQDDGRGLDLKAIKNKAIEKGLIEPKDKLSEKEIINLIFEPGFTTQEDATNYSGRGVGMDVVMNKLRQLRGSIEVTTEEGLGTSFTMRLPLSLSIVDVLHVKVGEINYLIPHIEIEQCFSERLHSDIIKKQGFNLKYNNKLIPHLNLMEIFNEGTSSQTSNSILIINKNGQNIAIEVEAITGEAQLVIKPVDEALKSLNYLSGVSVLGNGELAFLLDCLKLKESFSENKKQHNRR